MGEAQHHGCQLRTPKRSSPKHTQRSPEHDLSRPFEFHPGIAGCSARLLTSRFTNTPGLVCYLIILSFFLLYVMVSNRLSCFLMCYVTSFFSTRVLTYFGYHVHVMILVLVQLLLSCMLCQKHWKHIPLLLSLHLHVFLNTTKSLQYHCCLSKLLASVGISDAISVLKSD